MKFQWGKIKENENLNKYMELACNLKKAVEHEDDGDANTSWYTRNCPFWKWKKKTRKLEIRWTIKTI